MFGIENVVKMQNLIHVQHFPLKAWKQHYYDL